MNAQYLTDVRGNKTAVLVPIREYEKILDDLDELECIKIYDKVKSRKLDFLPAEQVFKTIEKKRKKV